MKVVSDLGCFPTGRHYPGIAHLLRVSAAGLAEEFPGDVALEALAMVCVDTETTGRDSSTDRIVEIACVRWENGVVVRRDNWLVNPGMPIPKEAFDVHGISDDDVKDAPAFAEIAKAVLTALSGAVPVAYNADFDRSFLVAELARAEAFDDKPPPACRKGVDWVDPLVWARELQKYEKGKSLGEVTARLGIDIGTAHRATDDAEAALRVFQTFRSDARVPKTYAALIQEQRRLARAHDEERARWRSARS
ncbi:MAG: 3'-5' exonuclease [Polyangiaceae bacterium]